MNISNIGKSGELKKVLESYGYVMKTPKAEAVNIPSARLGKVLSRSQSIADQENIYEMVREVGEEESLHEND